MDGIDLARFLARLNEFDAVRADDTIKTGTVDRIQPKLATDWPHELDASIDLVLVFLLLVYRYSPQR